MLNEPVGTTGLSEVEAADKAHLKPTTPKVGAGTVATPSPGAPGARARFSLGDVLGGVAATCVALPQSMALGVGLFTGMGPVSFLRRVREVLLLAFSTSSLYQGVCRGVHGPGVRHRHWCQRPGEHRGSDGHCFHRGTGHPGRGDHHTGHDVIEYWRAHGRYRPDSRCRPGAGHEPYSH